MKRFMEILRRASMASNRFCTDVSPSARVRRACLLLGARVAFLEREDIGRLLHQPPIEQRLHLLLAQALDVEGVARDEMAEPLHRLRRADRARRCSGAPPRPSSRTAWLPQPGTRSGNSYSLRFLRPLLEVDATAPAGSRRRRAGSLTVSPTRTSLRLISSSLCSVALDTTTPPTLTGCSIAVGVSAPVRPTVIVMSFTHRASPARRETCARSPSAGCARRSRAAPASRAGRPCRPRRRCRSRALARSAFDLAVVSDISSTLLQALVSGLTGRPQRLNAASIPALGFRRAARCARPNHRRRSAAAGSR